MDTEPIGELSKVSERPKKLPEISEDPPSADTRITIQKQVDRIEPLAQKLLVRNT